MKLFPSVKALFALLLGLIIIAGLSGCGGTGGESDTEAPEVTLNALGVDSNLEQTRHLSGGVEPGAKVEITANTDAKIGVVNIADGAWSCDVQLVPGLNTISVKGTDPTGNNRTLTFFQLYGAFTLDLVLPSTALSSQTLQGTFLSGTTLTGTLDGNPITITQDFTTLSWTSTLNDLAPGTHNLVLVGTVSGYSTTQNETLVVDPTLPLVTVNPVTAVAVNSVTIGGTIENNTNLSVGSPTGATVDLIVPLPPDGWSGQLSGLLPGRNQINITASRSTDNKLGSARLFVFYKP